MMGDYTQNFVFFMPHRLPPLQDLSEIVYYTNQRLLSHLLEQSWPWDEGGFSKEGFP